MKLRWILLGAIAMMVAAPAFTFAAHIPLNQNVWDVKILAGPLTVCTGNYINPQGPYASANAKCTDLCDFVAQILQILYFIIALGIWIIVPIMVVHAGIMLILSRGNPAKASEARKSATGAVIGVFIMLCAWLIVNTFVTFFGLSGFIGGFGSGNTTNCLVAPAPAPTQNQNPGTNGG